MSGEQPVPSQVQWPLCHPSPPTQSAGIEEAGPVLVLERRSTSPGLKSRGQGVNPLPQQQPWHCASVFTRKIGRRCVEPHSASQAHSACYWWVDCQRSGHPLRGTVSIAQPVPHIHYPLGGISVTSSREKGPACLPAFVTGAQGGEQNSEARQYF